jgi:hypothetical protein
MRGETRGTLRGEHGDEVLLRGWRGEKVGMHRGDVCRGVALHQQGGYYLDLDLLANFDVREVMRPGGAVRVESS